MKRQIENQQHLAQMEREKIRYQFETLKNQTNPHFLFNSLNILASLAYQDAEKTNSLSRGWRKFIVTCSRRTIVKLCL